MSKSLLPINASQLLKDLENSSLKAISLEALNRYVTNPDLAPDNILPWLAWAVSVDDWSDNLSLAVKKNVIKASINVHKKKGTIGALRSALEAFNYENIIVEEWFDYDGDPHFFRVFFDVTEPGFDVGILPQVQKVIDNTKNVRSHLESLRAFLSAEMGLINMGSAMISKEITPLPQFIYENDDEIENVSSMPLIASSFFVKELATVNPVIYEEDDNLENESDNPVIGLFLLSKEITVIDPVSYDTDDEIISDNSSMPVVGAFLLSKEITVINPL